MLFKQALVRLHWLLATQFGLDPRLFVRGVAGIPRYVRDLTEFRRSYKGELSLVPCLHDWRDEAGATKNEYFWQDLLLAKRIFEANPRHHVDIGSRIDGFVTHVASFRSIEVFDVRPVSTVIPGVTFSQANVMSQDHLPHTEGGHCDSLSCLHALEHFGLGRYGDPIDERGYEKGIANMAGLLSPGGTFYLSTPVGRPRVAFNANRVFDPRDIARIAKANRLELSELWSIGSNSDIQYMQGTAADQDRLADQEYSLGVFVFKKLS